MFLCSVLFSGRLYLDNYRTSYSLYGRLFPVFRFDPIGTCGSRVTCVRSSFFLSFFRNGCPRILYNRGCCPASQRTEDARLCNFPLVRKKKKRWQAWKPHTHTRARTVKQAPEKKYRTTKLSGTQSARSFVFIRTSSRSLYRPFLDV